MSIKFKNVLLFIIVMITGIIVASCGNADEKAIEVSKDAQVRTRTVGNKTPKLTVYIETNDINPLNAGEYRFCGTTEEVVDHVILFASNIRGNCNSVWLHHNPNQTHILNNVNTLVRPLQNKGIKVLLGLLGDHTGVGFANLTPAMIESFATQVANCVNTYGLDGVDFDDEYAKYGTLACTPALPNPSSTIHGNLIQRLRFKLDSIFPPSATSPRKLITAFNFGYTGFNQATMNALDYMWPNYGCSSYPPSGLPNSKWAKLSVNFSPLNPGQSTIQNCASSYAGYGALMTFNLRDYNCSGIMNYFAYDVWGEDVCWTGTVHPKNY